MTKSVVRFSLIAMLLVAVTTLVTEHRGFWYGSALITAAGASATYWPPASGLRSPLVADGSPIPWPESTSRPSPKAADSPRMMADGSPIPWPDLERMTRLSSNVSLA